VFVDSPLAVKTTKVFRAHKEAHDAETAGYMRSGDDPFMFERLRYIQDVQESKALNDLRGPYIVISASGMCEAGRILHHLKNSVEDPRNTVLITGFQAEHTLGRKIVENQAEIPIFGDPYRLRAEVVKLNELSGHADQQELLAWLRPAVAGLKRIFLVHGEPAQQAALSRAIESVYGVPVTIPARGESFDL
jgi:metallo-beta-lactamase family protein